MMTYRRMNKDLWRAGMECLIARLDPEAAEATRRQAEIDTDFVVPERDQAVLVVVSTQSAAWLIGADGERIESLTSSDDGSDLDEWAFVVPADATEFELWTNTHSNRNPDCCDPEKGVDHKTIISIPT